MFCGLVRLGWVCLVGLAVCSCASMSKKKSESLSEVVQMFHHDLRWKFNRAAAAVVHPIASKLFLERLDEIEDDLNVTGWDVNQVEIDPTGTRAEVRVTLEYFQMPSTVLKKDKLKQVWTKRDGQWILDALSGGPVEIEAPEEPPLPASMEEDASADAKRP